MRILVTGITGYVGGALAPRLVEAGHDVRGLARDPRRCTLPGIECVRGDAVSGAGLDEALRGDRRRVLPHPLHGATGTEAFASREERSARNFAEAAVRQGVERVVYLGGPVPQDAAVSPHLASRLAVERTLLEAIPDSVALRASVVIGARSRSFRFLVRLVERMPVIPLPPWSASRTRPIDGRDVLAFLVNAATVEEAGGRSLDIAGPDVVTWGEMIERIRDLMLVGRPGLRLPRQPDRRRQPRRRRDRRRGPGVHRRADGQPRPRPPPPRRGRGGAPRRAAAPLRPRGRERAEGVGGTRAG